MYKIGKTYNFSAAHTIPGHPKCGNLHGHNYEVTVVLESGVLDVKGMVVDYGNMDAIIKPIIEELDHKYLAFLDDVRCATLQVREVIHLPINHSTAECIAEYLFRRIDGQVTWLVKEVTVCETPKTFATYSKNEG